MIPKPLFHFAINDLGHQTRILLFFKNNEILET